MEIDEMDMHKWVSQNRIPNDVDVHVLRNLGRGDVGFFHSKIRKGVCIRFYPKGASTQIKIHVMPLGCMGKSFMLGEGENEYFTKEDARTIWNELVSLGFVR
jgi:hypothetical protein